MKFFIFLIIQWLFIILNLRQMILQTYRIFEAKYCKYFSNSVNNNNLCLWYSKVDGRHLVDMFVTLPLKKDYPDYYKVISEPIDMMIIENKIKSDKVNVLENCLWVISPNRSNIMHIQCTWKYKLCTCQFSRGLEQLLQCLSVGGAWRPPHNLQNAMVLLLGYMLNVDSLYMKQPRYFVVYLSKGKISEDRRY